MTDAVRELERDSIRRWIAFARDAGWLVGRVLDYGCGRQPYRELVEANGAEYVPFDRATFPANVSGEDVGEDVWAASLEYDTRFETVLCTQVIQYQDDPGEFLRALSYLIAPGGHLVLTGPTCWAEVEPHDLQRFTSSGIRRALEAEGYSIVALETRAAVDANGMQMPLGYGVVAAV